MGKIIGVYLRRPFEGWSYEKIMAELGEVNYYVHERRKMPLIVTDDDISGTFTFLRALPDYGYDRYGGNCHMVPNHGLIIHALLHGDGDFQRSLMIVNTCGWDTDCNSGNVGCILGIRNGLTGIDGGPDWRGPVADRHYLPTADGGRCITDAVTEAIHIVNSGHALSGEAPVAPKNGARFHFEFPGAVQGVMPENSVETNGTTVVENVEGYSATGSRSLAIRYRGVAPGRIARAATPTFVPLEHANMGGYGLYASPTLYSGQTVRAAVAADAGNERTVTCRLYVQAYSGDETLATLYAPETRLKPGSTAVFNWTTPDTHGQPIAAIGIEVASEQRADGAIYLDYLTWDGVPTLTLGKPVNRMARRAWVDGVDHYESGERSRFGWCRTRAWAC